jgi:hypothetical protein
VSEDIERPGGTVYGDAVNVAARLESIGEPGGVNLQRPLLVIQRLWCYRDRLDLRVSEISPYQFRRLARTLFIPTAALRRESRLSSSTGIPAAL